MTLPQLTHEIRDMNLSYLLLAQSIIRSDKARAPSRLGMSVAVAELLAQVSPQQLVRVASRSLMLCTLRLNEELVWGLLSDRHVPHDRTDSPVDRRPVGQPMAEFAATGVALAETAS
jgi:flagellar transcriptional activator FlhD